MKINESKLKAIEVALKNIEKQFGKGSVMRLGETSHMNVDVISTGSLKINRALGGGVPKGRIVEIFGPESSGKTTIALHIIKETQAQGGVCAFIDVEHALDPKYARALGIDIDNLIVAQPDSGEEALEIAEALVRSGAISAIVIDSVAALVPRAEIEGEMGDSHVGLQARLLSQALRKLTGTINKTGCVAVFINQLREKVGVMFGNPETTPGGRALKFFSTIRIDIRRTGSIKGKDGEVLANDTKVKIVKNKIAPPFREEHIEIVFGKGIDVLSEIIDIGVEVGIINKSGSWFSYGDERLGQGKENVKKYLTENPKVKQEIEAKIYSALDIPYTEQEEVQPIKEISSTDDSESMNSLD